MNLEDALAAARISLSAEVSLFVAYDDVRGLEAHNVRLARDAADGFRALARDWVDSLTPHVPVPYEATAELNAGQAFHITDAGDLAEFAPLYDLADRAAHLQPLDVGGVDHGIALYGLAAGTSGRIAFFKRSDPRIGYAGGRRFLAILGERLQRLTEPTFAFYATFDFMLAPDWALIVNQMAFERLFRDAGLVAQHIDAWVMAIGRQLPWADGSVAALRDVAHKDSRVWRRLREINQRGHLDSVSIEQIRDYAHRMELDVSHLIRNDTLVFDPSERFSVIHLLNEDLFRGPLTNARFEAQRKSGA